MGTINSNMVGAVVQSTVGIWGILEYLTADGWAGIRGPGGRLDEVRADLVTVDPT